MTDKWCMRKALGWTKMWLEPFISRVLDGSPYARPLLLYLVVMEAHDRSEPHLALRRISYDGFREWLCVPEPPSDTTIEKAFILLQESDYVEILRKRDHGYFRYSSAVGMPRNRVTGVTEDVTGVTEDVTDGVTGTRYGLYVRTTLGDGIDRPMVNLEPSIIVGKQAMTNVERQRRFREKRRSNAGNVTPLRVTKHNGGVTEDVTKPSRPHARVRDSDTETKADILPRDKPSAFSGFPESPNIYICPSRADLSTQAKLDHNTARAREERVDGFAHNNEPHAIHVKGDENQAKISRAVVDHPANLDQLSHKPGCMPPGADEIHPAHNSEAQEKTPDLAQINESAKSGLVLVAKDDSPIAKPVKGRKPKGTPEELRERADRDSVTRNGVTPLQQALPGVPAPKAEPWGRAEFRAYYEARFFAERGTMPMFAAKEHAIIMSLLREPGGLDGAMARCDRMFDMIGKYPVGNAPSLGVLRKHWDHFAPPAEHPDTQVASERYAALFQEKRGAQPTWINGERAALDRLVRAVGADEVVRRAGVMFATRGWPAFESGDLHLLAKHFDRFASVIEEKTVRTQEWEAAGLAGKQHKKETRDSLQEMLDSSRKQREAEYAHRAAIIAHRDRIRAMSYEEKYRLGYEPIPPAWTPLFREDEDFSPEIDFPVEKIGNLYYAKDTRHIREEHKKIFKELHDRFLLNA